MEEKKWTKGGEARRVVGQERPQVLADGVLYYMYAKHRDTVSHIHMHRGFYFQTFQCVLLYFELHFSSSVSMLAESRDTQETTYFIVIKHASVLTFTLAALLLIFFSQIRENCTAQNEWMRLSFQWQHDFLGLRNMDATDLVVCVFMVYTCGVLLCILSWGCCV